jgi:hypothetical protein
MAVTFESLGTQVITGSASNSVTFSSITSAYTDLFLVAKLKMTSGDQDLRIRFNGDTSNNYATVSFYVTTAGADGGNALIGLPAGYLTNWSYDNANSFGCHETYIMNYGSSKHKSWCNEASSQNGSDVIQGIWQSTSAITSIYLYCASSSWVVGSSFELYGIKAA